MNTKIRYGLRTMIEIALPENKNGILQKEIARKQMISEKYLDPIISGLKAAGLIINTRGKKSGYVLAKQSAKISVHDVYRAFESELSLSPCLLNQGQCSHSNDCSAMEYWNSLNDTVNIHMKQKNLKQLADQEQKFILKRQQTVQNIIMAQIKP